MAGARAPELAGSRRASEATGSPSRSDARRPPTRPTAGRLARRWRAAEIRESFLSLLRGARPSPRPVGSSLIPPPESGLLLTNAGMNQFIPYFLGHAPAAVPARDVRARSASAPNDIENVGHTARHLTMFEMLGNFSFGDYFKADAVRWAHELVTEGYGIDHDRLWVTVFETDEEADRGLGRRRASATSGSCAAAGRREGEPANYWSHARRRARAGHARRSSSIAARVTAPEGGPDVDEERFMEIWNLVFMQDEVDDQEKIVGELPAKNIDTGSSLERVAIVLQDKDNVLRDRPDRPLLEVVESLSGGSARRDERDDVSLKVDRGARSRDDVPDRRRRPALERGPRLPAAPDAPAGRQPRAPPRHRGRGHAERWSAARSSSSATPTPSSWRTARTWSRSRARRRSGSPPRSARGCRCSRTRSAARRRREAAVGRRRVQAPRHLRLPQGADARARRGVGPRHRRGRASTS